MSTARISRIPATPLQNEPCLPIIFIVVLLRAYFLLVFSSWESWLLPRYFFRRAFLSPPASLRPLDPPIRSFASVREKCLTHPVGAIVLRLSLFPLLLSIIWSFPLDFFLDRLHTILTFPLAVEDHKLLPIRRTKTLFERRSIRISSYVRTFEPRLFSLLPPS